MYRKFTVPQSILWTVLSLLASVILLAVLYSSQVAAGSPPTNLLENRDRTIAGESFDYERAAEISAMRWQAMARFYEKHGLLTRDNFDYEQAANSMAYRWYAMAQAYERLGLLRVTTQD